MSDCAQSAPASVREMYAYGGGSAYRHAHSRQLEVGDRVHQWKGAELLDAQADHAQRRRDTLAVSRVVELCRIDRASELVRLERERQAVRRRDLRPVGQL